MSVRPTDGLVDGGLLADRYRLVERIAVGGMGEVWRAEDLLLGRVVAVKSLKPEYVGDKDFRDRFRAEARHAGRLAHPGIASVYDFGEDDDCAWLVMELVEGEPLSALLRREGPLPVDRALDVVAQTAAALQAAHDGGVVHRDIKPGNLLVRPDGVVKVTDFGIASAADAVPLTRTGTLVGTAFYLSPEQAAGRGSSPSSDLYSLGVVAYECLSGRRPFPGENPIAVALAHVREEPPPLRAAVPGPVRDLVMRALAKNPAERFEDAAELHRRAEALRAALAGGPWSQEHDEVPAPPATEPAATGLLELPVPRRRAPVLVVAGLVGLLAAIAVGSAVRSLTTSTAGGAPGAVAAAVAAPSPAPSPTPERVAVDAADYLGRPAAQARSALADRGLVPRLSYDGSGQPVGTVSAVEPTGPVAVGSAVLLRVVPQPPPAPAQVAPAPAPAPQKGPPKGKGNDKGKGPK